jgi:hypothetical protein
LAIEQGLCLRSNREAHNHGSGHNNASRRDEDHGAEDWTRCSAVARRTKRNRGAGAGVCHTGSRRVSTAAVSEAALDALVVHTDEACTCTGESTQRSELHAVFESVTLPRSQDAVHHAPRLELPRQHSERVCSRNTDAGRVRACSLPDCLLSLLPLSRLLSSCALVSSAPLSNVAATSASFALPPVNDVRSRLEAANSS